MKKELNEYMLKSISNWDKIYNGILIYDWQLVKDKYAGFRFDFEIPDDIRISLLALFGENLDQIIHSKHLTEFIGDSSIYELLTGTSKYNYSISQGLDLVKWYLINYWSFKYR